MKPEVEMYFTDPADLSKKYHSQLSQVKYSLNTEGVKINWALLECEIDGRDYGRWYFMK